MIACDKNNSDDRVIITIIAIKSGEKNMWKLWNNRSASVSEIIVVSEIMRKDSNGDNPNLSSSWSCQVGPFSLESRQLRLVAWSGSLSLHDWQRAAAWLPGRAEQLPAGPGPPAHVGVVFASYWVMALARKHLDPWHPDIEFRTLDIERNIRYRRLRHRMLIRYRHFLLWNFTFDMVHRYRMCSISKVTLLDIEGDIPSISKVMKRTVDIEVSSFRYRT